MAYIAKYLDGKTDVRDELNRLAQDDEDQTSKDVDGAIHIEARLDAQLNQYLRLKPPPTGQRVTLPPPQRGVFGDQVTLSIEAPEGTLTVTALPYQDGDRGALIANTVNGLESVTFDVTGHVVFNSNGDTRWTSITQLAQTVETGTSGSVGPIGETGATGETGARGVQGPQGERGDQGDTGEQGSPGRDGAAGATGAQGAPGSDGSDGADGVPGPQGLPGATGAAGTNGTNGPPGDAGSDGADGSPGPPGATGAQGTQGIQGNPGPPGDTGEKGDQGDQGPPGAAGTNGTNGASGILPFTSTTEPGAGPFNDYAIPNLSTNDFLLTASGANVTFTGFASTGGNVDGYRFKLLTGSAGSGTLSHNAVSIAANRLFNGGNVDKWRRARELVEFEYFSGGWRTVMSTPSAVQSNAAAESVSTEGGSVAVASSAGMLITAETGTRHASSPISGKSGLIEIVPGATISTPAANITALSAGSAVQEPLLVGTSAIRERVGYLITDGRTANLAQTAAITNITISTVAINANGWVAAATQPTAFLLSGRFLFNHAGGAATPTITIEALINAVVQATVVITPVTATATFGGEVQAVFTCRAIGATGSAFVNVACINNFGSTLTSSYATSNNAIVAGTFDTTAASSVTLRIRMTTVVASNVLTVTEGFGGRIS